MIKAVLFDFDETLQDRTLAFDHYADAFLQAFFPGISKEDAQKKKQDMIDTGNGGYVNRVAWVSELITMWHWVDSPGAESLARHYDEKFGFFNVIFDDAVPLLTELRKRGIKTGVITNGPSVLQHTKMENSGLMPYMDILVVSGDLEFAKPQPEIFEYTAAKLGLKTDDCIYVGDHPVNDIQGALSAGMHALRMNWGWFKNQDLRPDVPVIASLSEVINYVS